MLIAQSIVSLSARVWLADDTLEYDYDDDYDKLDTEPPGSLTEAFYAAVDTLTIQQARAAASACVPAPGC